MTKHKSKLDVMIEKAWKRCAVPHGFEIVTSRRCVRSRKPYIREIVEVVPLKGAIYTVRWGISVDFVPWFTSWQFSSKRTVKAARIDLVLNPLGENTNHPNWCSFGGFGLGIYGLRPATQADVDDALFAAMAVAEVEFDRVNSLEDLANTFATRSKADIRTAFHPHFHSHTDLCWGLVLHAIGRTKEGNKHLDRFCKRLKFDRNLPYLEKAVTTARNLHQNG